MAKMINLYWDHALHVAGEWSACSLKYLKTHSLAKVFFTYLGNMHCMSLGHGVLVPVILKNIYGPKTMHPQSCADMGSVLG
jgi:hypothetical protein